MEAEICASHKNKLATENGQNYFPELEKIDGKTVFPNNLIQQTIIVVDDGEYEIIQLGPAFKITIKNHNIDHIDIYLFKEGKKEKMYHHMTWRFDGDILYRKFSGMEEEKFTKDILEKGRSSYDKFVVDMLNSTMQMQSSQSKVKEIDYCEKCGNANASCDDGKKIYWCKCK